MSAQKQLRHLFEIASEASEDERSVVLSRLCGTDHELKQRLCAMLEAAESEDFLEGVTRAELEGTLRTLHPATPAEAAKDAGKVRVQCPSCAATFQVAGTHLGRRARCRTCDNPFELVAAQTDAAGDAPHFAGPAESAGQRVGSYRLLQKIGEGGFGDVWMAEQREPVRRRVALKVIKLGMDTRQVVARFEAERQALAMMEHPNIAKVFDAGTTATGRPFFVMELVKGLPITEFCDKHHLPMSERLELFHRTCLAVQHAHQKGVIHRDLKPSNILVTLHDGIPVPKVIDFGIAKATSAELTQRTLFTEYEQIIGTPAYMAPEQAEMSGLDIDTRADLYSLGVLLYEMLTGSQPFDQKKLLKQGYMEMLRAIREEDPPKPSTRVSTYRQHNSALARSRDTTLPSLRRLLRGDLDWIVMRCLEKDRTRRYESAHELAMDVQRHLDDEPVLAGPPGVRYRLEKFVRRNRGKVAAAGLVGVSLVVGIVVATNAMFWALDEKALAKEAEQERSRELDRANEIKRLIKEMLTSVSPMEIQGMDVTLLRRILDDAARRLDRGEVVDPLNAAELHALIGGVYLDLGAFDSAERHIPEALEIRTRLLGAEDPGRLASAFDMAELHRESGAFAKALALGRETLAARERVLGEGHADTIASMLAIADTLRAQHRGNLDAEGLSLGERALRISRSELGSRHETTLQAMHDLAVDYMALGERQKAVNLLTEAHGALTSTKGSKHPLTMRVQARLDDAEQDPKRAVDAIQRSRELVENVVGAAHPIAVGIALGVAHRAMELGEYARVAEMMRAALANPNGRGVNPAECRLMLGRSLVASGEFAAAVPILERAIVELEKVANGDEHQPMAARRLLVEAYEGVGRHVDARPLRARVQDHYAAELARRIVVKRHFGGTGTVSPRTAYNLYHAAFSYLAPNDPELHDPQKARDLLLEAQDRVRQSDGFAPWDVPLLLALAHAQSGDQERAVATQRDALAKIHRYADARIRERAESRLREFAQRANVRR